MAIIEMIPPHYWEQIKNELNDLDPSELTRLVEDDENDADTIQKETPEARRARIYAEYDEAMENRRREDNRRIAEARQQNSEYIEQQRKAAREYWRKKKAADPNPRRPPGKPRAPTDGLTPEQIAKREKNRERSAQYRERCKRATEAAKNRHSKQSDRKPTEATQSHANTSVL